MDGEVDDTGQDSSSISHMIDYVRNLLPGYSQENDEEECQEKIGDRLKKKRMRTKKRSSPLNKKEYPGVSSSRKRAVGCKRSMVRYIGSNVPMASSQEAYYELLDNSRRAFISSATNFVSANLDHVRQHVDQVKYHVVPTLADIGQLVWDGFDEDEEVVYEEEEECEEDEEDEEEYNEETNDAEDEGEKRDEATDKQQPKPSSSKPEESSSSTENKPSAEGAKINQLEDELAKLRAQIAMIVSGSAPLAPPSQPAPIAVVPPIILQAPPPPPPPPPPPAPSNNIAPVIKINKTAVKQTKKVDEEESAPNLSDVLRGLSSVKLKSVPNRSPGGTPMKAIKSSKAESNDPADIIARALKEKFRNTRTSYDSPETDSSPSGFSPSPRKNKRSPKVISSMARPVPRPRPKPRPKTQKKVSSRDNNDTEKTKLFK